MLGYFVFINFIILHLLFYVDVTATTQDGVFPRLAYAR